jgi:hypothetical protein
MAAEQVQTQVEASAESSPPEGTDHVQARIEELYSTLDKRGVGEHQCPFGTSCTKGAVQNGIVTVFYRNSHFKYVCTQE